MGGSGSQETSLEKAKEQVGYVGSLDPAWIVLKLPAAYDGLSLRRLQKISEIQFDRPLGQMHVLNP